MKKSLFAIILVVGFYAQSQEKSTIHSPLKTSVGALQFYQFTEQSTASKFAWKEWVNQNLSLSEFDSFELISQTKHQDDWTVFRLKRSNRGFDVLNDIVIVHVKNGKIHLVISDLSEVEFETERSITDSINFDFESWKNEHQHDLLYQSFSHFDLGDNVWVDSDGKGVLCRQVQIKNYSNAHCFDVFVHPSSGEVLHVDQKFHFSTVPAQTKASTRYHDTVDIPVELDTNDNIYYLNDPGRNIDVIVKDEPTDPFSIHYVEHQDSLWDDSIDRKLGIYDAYYAAQVTYDYFDTVFGRRSYGGNGEPLVLKFELNEHFFGNQTLYRDNGEIVFVLDTFSSHFSHIDNVAHEFSHGVISTSADFVTTGEPSILAESFADIFGLAVEYHYDSLMFSWVFGDGHGSGWPYDMVRDFAFLKSTNQVGFYPGYLDEVEMNPNFGRYRYAGILNLAFYLLIEGGSGTSDFGYDFSVESLGWEKATNIFYQALTNYMTPNTRLEDAAFCLFLTAQDLFGQCSTESDIIREAMLAVGLGKLIPQSVIKFSIDGTANCTNNKTVQFTNQSKFGTAVIWDFGDGTTSYESNPKHVYESNGTYDVQLIVHPNPGSCFESDTLFREAFVVLNDVNTPEACLPNFCLGSSGMLALNQVSFNDYVFNGREDIIDYEDFSCHVSVPHYLGDLMTVSMKFNVYTNPEKIYPRIALDMDRDGQFSAQEHLFYEIVSLLDSFMLLHVTVPEFEHMDSLYRLRIGLFQTNNDLHCYWGGHLSCYEEVNAEIHDFALLIKEKPTFNPGPIAQLWPNPALNYLHVHIRYADDISSLAIKDINGRKIRELLIEEDNVLFIDLSSLSPGIYYFQADMKSGEHYMERFVVK